MRVSVKRQWALSDPLAHRSSQSSNSARFRRIYAAVNTKQWLIALGFGIMSSILASYFTDTIIGKKPPSQDIKTEITNLAQIQSSLAQLQTYVGSQQTRLEKINTDIQDLTDKKQRLEKVVSVNEQAVHELLRHYESLPKGVSWFDQALSFFIGCLSSLFVVFLVGFMKRKKLIDRET